MPKIDAPTVREHVDRQTDAILDAAARLVAEHGLRGVDLGMIAREVHLKRTSIYRYFPNRDAIVSAWIARELPRATARGVAVLGSDLPAPQRVAAWLDLQVELTAEPDHRLAVRVVREIGGLSPEAHAEMAEGHRDLYSRVEPLLAELVGEQQAPLASQLLSGLIRAAGEAVDGGTDPATVADALRRAAAGLLETPAVADPPPQVTPG